MKRVVITCCLFLAAPLGPAAGAAADQAAVERVLSKLNAHATVAASDSAKSYPLLFDAWLDATEPPAPIGPEFNLATIHPARDDWSSIAAWAESNGGIAEAILATRDRTVFGLPYGHAALPQKYARAGYTADVGTGGDLWHVEFPYLGVMEGIAAFATAETYRLMEAGDIDEGLDLALATLFVLRQLADRDFLDEKTVAVEMLTVALGNLRDLFLRYQEKITPVRFSTIAQDDMPFLRPDRGRLLMPEADRVVSEALIESVFDAASGNADPEAFAATFAAIQSEEKPLTRFGAARRWKMIAEVHGSLDATLERLTLVYDDWWRRWRVQEYDEILAIDPQFERTNQVRYAAVIYALQNIESLFQLRNRLIAEVNGTALAAGLCAYKRELGRYPSHSEQIYSIYVRKTSDRDPYDRQFDHFMYRTVDSRTAVDTPYGRVWVEPGQCLLYSKGQDNEDQRAREHSPDGFTGDKVIWPPMRTLARQQGLME